MHAPAAGMSSPTLSKQQIEALETRLASLRAELEAAISQGKEGAAPVELDQTRVGRLSRMDAMQGQAMAKAANERAALELAQVKAAQRRLSDADFGLCLDCDEAIAWPRLQLNPGVRLCITCAQQREV